MDITLEVVVEVGATTEDLEVQNAMDLVMVGLAEEALVILPMKSSMVKCPQWEVLQGLPGLPGL